jgi:hypothetical protein
MWGGGATQAVLPPAKDANSCSKLADLGKAANPHVTVSSKVAKGPDVEKSCDNMRIQAMSQFLCEFLNERF